MSSAESPDTPPFDIVQFEAAAKERAAEFVDHVARLSCFDLEFDFDDKGLEFELDDTGDWIASRGAQYNLPDGSQCALKHEVWHQDPTKVIAKVRATRPPVESTGIDGQRRRTTLTRFVMYASFTDELDSYLLEFGNQLPPLPYKETEPEWLRQQVEMSRIEDMLHPGYRPAELIAACTSTLVECKLPNSPNFRTERYAGDMPADTRLAHIAARRQAGEQVVDASYDIAEHRALIASLAALDPDTSKPRPLHYDFDETWKNPVETIRSWRPSD